jgi:hypothetical protein
VAGGGRDGLRQLLLRRHGDRRTARSS